MDDLKKDIEKIIILVEIISKYKTMILFNSNLSDKINYDPKKCILLNDKIEEFTNELDKIKDKWQL